MVRSGDMMTQLRCSSRDGVWKDVTDGGVN